jgi:hypothetical protein
VSLAAALYYDSQGGGAAVAFHRQVDAYDTYSLIGALGELRGFLGGQKMTLLWDGLPPTQQGDAAGLAGSPAALAGGGATGLLTAGRGAP